MINTDAILLVTFGSSYPQAKRAYSLIEKMTAEMFPNIYITWAYTSKIVREKLKKTANVYIDSVEEALDRLQAQGFTKIAVQSLHVIPGSEYESLRDIIISRQAKAKDKNNEIKISLGKPLLSSINNIDKTNKILLKEFATIRSAESSVLFMGHGSEHYGGLIYSAVANRLEKLDPLAFIATIEGEPNLSDFLLSCKRKNISKILLSPYLSVVGDHALNDMAGEDNNNSWKAHVEKEGIEVITILKGLAEYPDIVEIWLSGLKESINANN